MWAVVRPPTTVGVRKLDMIIALSCSINTSAVHCLVFVTNHEGDGWTDRRTDRITTPKTVLA